MDATMVRDAWQKIPGYETLTLQQKNQPTVPAPITGLKAGREKLNFKDVSFANNIGLATNLAAFAIWNSTMSGATPRQGDLLTDSKGLRWIIQTAEQATMGEIWRVMASQAQ